MTIRLLHVYGQEAWHDDVAIVGNRAGLEALQAQLALVLAGPMLADYGEGYYVADGEGFGVRMVLDDADWQSSEWQSRPRPYSADYAQGAETRGGDPGMENPARSPPKTPPAP